MHDTKSPQEAFFHHFSFITETEEDKDILRKLSNHLTSFVVNDKENALIAEIKIPYLKGENVKFFCKPPFTRIAEKKYQKVSSK
ncbi:hypothetical protein [Leptospira stimsonii]|uniref:hypothetical protein n=1 Tax=Leptospira stimsonii TaxID=2202203 RepID=UPI001FEDD473|nr:hypothetical protein [Leptospira stimsonii]